MVVEKTHVSVRVFAESFDSEEESSCYFLCGIGQNSKHTRTWAWSEGGDNPNVLLQKDSTITPCFLQLEASSFDQRSYSVLTDLLPPQVDTVTKDRIAKYIVPRAHELLFRSAVRRSLLTTLEINISTLYSLEEEDVDYKWWLLNRGRTELEEEECCSICLEDMRRNSLVTRLPCSHVFHDACIFEWLRDRNPTCPLCRFEVPDVIEVS